jgi:membrane protein implicated in regulation of membrane protease activity
MGLFANIGLGVDNFIAWFSALPWYWQLIIFLGVAVIVLVIALNNRNR